MKNDEIERQNHMTKITTYLNPKPDPVAVAKKTVLKKYSEKMSRLVVQSKPDHFAVHQGDAEKWLSILDAEKIPGFETKFSDPKLGSLDVRFHLALAALRKFLGE